MVRDILDTESMGYACVYPLDNGGRKEYMISLSPENLANFIGTYGLEAEKIVWCYVKKKYKLKVNFFR